jgi:hypothetical protein
MFLCSLLGEPDTGKQGTFRPFRAFKPPMSHDFSVRPPRILTPDERKARDAARRADAAEAMREHEKAQKAFHANRERLKAERLARDALNGSS